MRPDTLTIGNVTVDIPIDPIPLLVQEMCKRNGISSKLGSLHDPNYVRPDDTLDDAL